MRRLPPPTSFPSLCIHTSAPPILPPVDLHPCPYCSSFDPPATARISPLARLFMGSPKTSLPHTRWRLPLGFIIIFANSSMRVSLGAHHSTTSRLPPTSVCAEIRAGPPLSHAPYTPLRYSIALPFLCASCLPSVRILLSARFLFLVVATQKEARSPSFFRAFCIPFPHRSVLCSSSRLCVHPVRPRYHLPALPSVVPLSDETYRVLISVCTPELRSGLLRTGTPSTSHH